MLALDFRDSRCTLALRQGLFELPENDVSRQPLSLQKAVAVPQTDDFLFLGDIHGCAPQGMIRNK
jgi:hypothetical protein